MIIRSKSVSCSVVSDSLQLMDCSLPGFSVHEILQAGILELPCPSPGDLPNPGIESSSPELQEILYCLELPGKPVII